MELSRLPMPEGERDAGSRAQAKIKPDEEHYGAIPRSIDHGQFAPGQVILGRYRIVERIGRGGMGLVYRADDLKLDTTVALKFLPDEFADHPSRKARFLNEAKVALKITHPNVCRVYDISEVDGKQFISMEFVGGEDLGSVLRRVGRLPAERAAAIAVQICSGLQAAHEKGVLHRDLKPANVMLDADGRAKILDFGLAGMAEGITGGEVRAGTPAYMSPEQLRGEEVTIRSDIYGLGLLLYEIFTGKKAWEAVDVLDLIKLQKSSEPRDPRDLVAGLDERAASVILRCLAREPKDRPPTALAVMALLPGGDPLAAAIAAGETPSPEIIAASGSRDVLPPLSALVWLFGVLAFIIGVTVLGPAVSLHGKTFLERSPIVLASDAIEILDKLGYGHNGVYDVYALDYYEELIAEIRRNDDSRERWDRLSMARPAAIDFWYRRGIVPLRAMNAAGRVTMTDPAPTESGMISVRLSPAGQLRELLVRYRHGEDMSTPGGWIPQFDREDPERLWRLLFSLAQLPYESFEAVTPGRVPAVFADRRAAWLGVYPDNPEVQIRIEAASFEGAPVAFRIVETRWPRASVTATQEELAESRTAVVVRGLIIASLVMASLFLAYRNLARHRGDLRGALRVGGFALVVWFVGWHLRANHVWTLLGEGDLMIRAISQSLTVGAALVVFYLALEPIVRRVWPETLISWERVLCGHVRDPLVGQHVVAGVGFGGFAAFMFYLNQLTPAWNGLPPPPPFFETTFGLDTIMGARTALGATLHMVVWSVRMGMAVLLGLAILRLVLRNKWLAGVAFGLILTAYISLNTVERTLWTWMIFACLAGVTAVVVVRFGLLAIVVGAMAYILLVAFPLSLDPRVWYFDGTLFSHGLLAAMLAGGILLATGVIRSRPAGPAHATSISRAE